jgi:hypothetical protein
MRRRDEQRTGCVGVSASDGDTSFRQTVDAAVKFIDYTVEVCRNAEEAW